MERKPFIVCIGTMDTKGEEIRYLAEQVSACGGHPVIMDISLGHEITGADIPLAESLKMTGHFPEDIFLLDRFSAAAVVARAGTAKILELLRGGRLDGVIGLGGETGAGVIACLMRALPFGVPKVMLGSASSEKIRDWIGTSDIYFSNMISGCGVCRLSKQTIRKGVCAVTAMIMEGRKTGEEEGHPMAAVTRYEAAGEPADRCGRFMREQGWDTLYFRPSGEGALMEDLIRAGEIRAMFDLAPGELLSGYFGSRNSIPESWTGIRFTAAFDMGIPVVAAPGGLSESPFGMWELLPDEYKNEFFSGKRIGYRESGKPFFRRHDLVILPTTLQENRKLAQMIASRLNRAAGPGLFLIPLRGWSFYDQSEDHARSQGIWCDGAGAVWTADEKKPEWSARAVHMWEILSRSVSGGDSAMEILACDCHISDPPFAEICCQAMGHMLRGTWRKGLFRNLPLIAELPGTGERKGEIRHAQGNHMVYNPSAQC